MRSATCVRGRRTVVEQLGRPRKESTLRFAFALVCLTIAIVGCSRARRADVLRPSTVAYVSDEAGGDVVAVDVKKATVLSRMPAGKRPRAVKLSHDGTKLYVSLSRSPRADPGGARAEVEQPDRAADGIGVIDVATRRLVGKLSCGRDPESFDLSVDDRTLYVSNEETAELTVLDAASGAQKARVPVGREPEGVTVRADGKVVFVTSEQDDEVTAVDTGTLAVIAHIKTDMRPRSVVFTQAGSIGFVTAESGVRVTVIDGERFATLASIPITQSSPTPSGPRPMGAVLSPDDRTLYVSTGRGASVAIIDVASRRQIRSIDGAGGRPWGIAVSADGSHLFTANGTSSDLSILDVATGNVERRVQIGGLPWGVAL